MVDDFIIRHPSSAEDFAKRNQLLQACLREDIEGFDIAHEFPIVLSSEGACFSWILEIQGEVVAHLNAWPRSLQNHPHAAIAVTLVGNVCSAPHLRGRGLVRSLLEHVENEQRESSAMILWSDLTQFYQKLGFSSLATELRVVFKPEVEAVEPARISSASFPASELSPADCAKFLTLRPSLPLVLERSAEEFATLGQIPECSVFRSGPREEPSAFLILGKGADMVNVIHEWGAKNPAALAALLREALHQRAGEELMLLMPPSCSDAWLPAIEGWIERVETHPMALAKIREPKLESAIRQVFIWGLDSI